MVITKTTVNTGSMHFNNLNELNIFISDFSIVKTVREVYKQQKTDGSIIRASTVLTSSNIFEETIISHENVNLGVASELAAWIEALGWTKETVISYDYN